MFYPKHPIGVENCEFRWPIDLTSKFHIGGSKLRNCGLELRNIQTELVRTHFACQLLRQQNDVCLGIPKQMYT